MRSEALLAERKKRPDVPRSPKSCPLCKEEMNLEIAGLAQYYSCGGPYCSVSVRYRCGDCNFLDTIKLRFGHDANWFKVMHKIAKELEKRIGAKVVVKDKGFTTRISRITRVRR